MYSLVAALLLDAVLESAFVEIVIAGFPGESVFANALEATDRVSASCVFRVARIRLALVHILLASSAFESRLGKGKFVRGVIAFCPFSTGIPIIPFFSFLLD